MDEDGHCDNVDVPEGLSSPNLFAWNNGEDHYWMWKGSNTKFCDHGTSFLCGVASNIWPIHLTRVNKSMHPIMVFHWMDDGFKNAMNHWKISMKTMMEHLDTHVFRLHICWIPYSFILNPLHLWPVQIKNYSLFAF
jgi:hypothetical protein